MSKEQAFEARSFTLLGEIQKELAGALDSLEGKKHRGLEDQFPVYCAVHVNRATEGYIILRRGARLHASRLLIRPTIEATIKMLAVQKQPDLLYRIAYSEWLEDKKLIVGETQAKSADYLLKHQKNWLEFEMAYAGHFPDHTLVKEKLSLQCAAVIAGIGPYYESAYRLYYQFTHAAFRATTGDLDELYHHDNRTVALCALAALETVSSRSDSSLDIGLFRRRVKDLISPIED